MGVATCAVLLLQESSVCHHSKLKLKMLTTQLDNSLPLNVCQKQK
uniref:Uncharacterized protein n=1 Tax=Arundo donax TaxID=35708 RepID=A0A0A9ELQ6_ARUDO